MNHYETLGLTRSATQEDIQDAFIEAADWQDVKGDGGLSAAHSAFRTAIKARKPAPGLIHHSDQAVSTQANNIAR